MLATVTDAHMPGDLVQSAGEVFWLSSLFVLNPVLRGWANYHSHIVAKETFNYVDYRVWKLLWQWCRRRHQNRQKRWIKAKYFKTAGPRNWVFSGMTADGFTKRLVYTNDTAIKRHTKIKGEANPYDLAFEEYFEQRLERAWRDSMQGQRRLLILWLRQQKCCPICRHKITKETGWNIHHIVERVKGGSDEMDNLVLLHPNCHRQLHSCDI
ncbi:group II intron maturase-specific domain-containing protein [Shewanella sp.]|uniref:group II intron maturase-specific domain-containing protein n=1 Tax=Shewanella TaxID=22 RepID=UPI002580E895|nr:group II intron maturase-specific domain-containing protein [Shewanella sp.]